MAFGYFKRYTLLIYSNFYTNSMNYLIQFLGKKSIYQSFRDIYIHFHLSPFNLYCYVNMFALLKS